MTVALKITLSPSSTESGVGSPVQPAKSKGQEAKTALAEIETEPHLVSIQLVQYSGYT